MKVFKLVIYLFIYFLLLNLLLLIYFNIFLNMKDQKHKLCYFLKLCLFILNNVIIF